MSGLVTPLSTGTTAEPRATQLRHGYTMADLERLAHHAVAAAWPRAMDYSDRYDTAWHAIAELLYTADDYPSLSLLKMAGARAVDRLAQDHYHTWGMDRRNLYAGEGGMPGYQRYWHLARQPAPSPETAVVDRLALHQIWPRLSGTHRQVLLALASHADQSRAAEAVGKSTATFRSHLRSARRSFFELWHEGEAPSRLWGKDDHRRGQHTATQTLRNRRQQRDRRAQRARQAVAAGPIGGAA